MINPIKHLHCMKVLPLVYDDSLSYYEVLCKLRNKINEVITDINENLETYIRELIPTVVGNVTYIANTETLVITFEAGGDSNAD